MNLLIILVNLLYLLNQINGFSHINGKVLQSRIIVPPEISKERLDVYLTKELPNYSRSFIGNLCEKGNVLVNSIIKPKNCKISSGDIIDLNIIMQDDSKIIPENIPLDIIYEDNHILVINKSPGMVVHPAPGKTFIFM